MQNKINKMNKLCENKQQSNLDSLHLAFVASINQM